MVFFTKLHNFIVMHVNFSDIHIRMHKTSNMCLSSCLSYFYKIPSWIKKTLVFDQQDVCLGEEGNKMGNISKAISFLATVPVVPVA